MTITVGSRWKHKRTPTLYCVVVATIKLEGEKYIIFKRKTTRRDPRWSGDILIKSTSEFLKSYEHPEPVGDVP